ncbi:helix-turn-helix domain-containing protein [Hyalangium minutum]|uniref:Transcriptional regulator, XRE family protein n=1 Tax=Hyalangium minutum TaxID=394096 RepID=A0A085WP24_9BACT|nr:helix-turn-helix transcriptional regulator [Hyalangium minutum]KFE69437.1 Transcriptional regulator, XRE family protein [Hyalangium minutum]
MSPALPRAKIATQLGTAARQARHHLRLTQAEVAEQTGIALEVYGRIERGVLLPSLQTFVALCRVLEADPRLLLGFLEASSLPVEERAPAEAPGVRRLTRMARELSEEEVRALLSVAKVLLARRGEGRTRP